MSDRIASYGNIEMRVKDNLVTISFDCDFGPIAFSFNPEKLSAKLSIIVSETLDRIHQVDPDTLNGLAKDSKRSIEAVKKTLESHILKSRKTTPPSALEKFMEGRNLTLEGSLQQMMESLPASIILMLTHLATATLTTTTDVINGANSKVLLIDHELHQLIYTKFRDSINRLWEQSQENRD